MTKGDIVLIPFPFTDLSGSKLRPAIVLAKANTDLTLCFISSQTSWQQPTDMLLSPNINNGLRKLSLAKTNKIATINAALAKGLLGRLSAHEVGELNSKLKALLQL